MNKNVRTQFVVGDVGLRCLAPNGRVKITFIIALFLTIVLSSCNANQQAQPDPYLKFFHILSARIIMLDSSAEVDGTVQNTGQNRYPFDVTIDATFYNSSGNVIGHAEGVAEDIFPGMTHPFVLKGDVDSLHYSHMELTPVSLRERRQEKNLPSPPPITP